MRLESVIDSCKDETLKTEVKEEFVCVMYLNLLLVILTALALYKEESESLLKLRRGEDCNVKFIMRVLSQMKEVRLS